MSQWYYVHGGDRQGPVDRKALDSVARSGGLSPEDLVWTEGMKDWRPAREVPGLFGAPAAAPAAATPVASGASPAAATDPSNPYASPASMVEVPVGQSATADGLQIIEPPAALTVGGPIQMAFEILKKDFGMIFVAGLVYVAVLIGVGMVLGVIEQVVTFALAAGAGQGADEGAVLGAAVGVSVVFAIPRIAANTYMSLGLARVAMDVIEGKPVRIGALFGEGKRLLGAFGGAILFALMIYALPMLAMIPGFLVGMDGDEEMMMVLLAVGGLLFIFPGLYLTARFGFFMTVMVDQDKRLFEAFGECLRLTRGSNGWVMFVVLIVTGLMNLAGLLVLCVGLIFTIPLTVLIFYVSYKWMAHGPEPLWEIHRPKLPGM
jgi:hypothetical protein